MMTTKVDVLGVFYDVTDYERATDTIVKRIENNESFSVFALPVHGVIERRKDAEFDAAVQSADMIVPDGQPIRWAMNLIHKTGLDDRVYGPQLLRSILIRKRSKPIRVFAYGGRNVEVLESFVSHLENDYKNVIVCGAYREPSISEITLTPAMVQETEPDLVLVGLGCPIQEKWIAKNGRSIQAPAIGVGAAFSFLSGDQKFAPIWMQNSGLEWLHRLLSEPKRLWKRYLYTNTYFILLMLKGIFQRSFKSQDYQ